MHVTLNIGTTSIRLLATKGKQVKKWAELPLEPGLVQDGLILQPNAVAAGINALFESQEVRRNRVIISLSGLSFTYRTLNLPAVPRSLQEEAIQRGVRKEIPVPLEELYLSWQPVGSADGELSFFVLGVPRNLIDALVHTLAEAGVRPYIMDLRALALARVANRADAILLSLEPDCYDIVVVANGTPAILHTIAPRGAGASIEDNMMRVVNELSRTVEFYNSGHPEGPLSPTTPLLLTGELSTDSAVSQLIQEGAGYPVEPLVPPLILPPDLPAASYTANIGLALKKMRRKTVSRADITRFHDININILSAGYGAETPLAVVGRVLVPVALVIAIGLLYPAYLIKDQTNAETVRLETELATVNEALRDARLEADEAKQVEDSISKLAADLEALQQQLLTRGGEPADNLKMVTDAITRAGYFTSVDIDANQVIVRGMADTATAVIDYVTSLETRGVFSEVRIAEINTNGAGETGSTGNEGPEVSFMIVMTR